MKKGALYILGHVIVTDDFETGVHEAKSQSQAWTRYISEFSRIKAFVQLNMSPSITWYVHKKSDLASSGDAVRLEAYAMRSDRSDCFYCAFPKHTAYTVRRSS